MKKRTRTIRLVVVGFYVIVLIYLGISMTVANNPLVFPAGALLNGWWLLTLIALLSVPMFAAIVAEKRQRRFGNAQSPLNKN